MTTSESKPFLSRDRGATFIELLVAIVLIGTVVVAVLVALQAATVASTVDANHARAITWLQQGSDKIFEAQRYSCTEYLGAGNSDDPDNATADLLANWRPKATRVGSPADSTTALTIWGKYKAALAATTAPVGWTGGTIEITAIEFLGRPTPNSPFFEWGPSYCYEGVQPDANGDGDPEVYRLSPFLAQKVTIKVTGPGGAFTKTIETVKGGR